MKCIFLSLSVDFKNEFRQEFPSSCTVEAQIQKEFKERNEMPLGAIYNSTITFDGSGMLSFSLLSALCGPTKTKSSSRAILRIV